jgi:hypothetical protein
MIGRWFSALHFSNLLYSFKLRRGGVVETSCVGPLPRKGCLMLNLSIMSLFPMTMTPSLIRVFGKIRFPRESRSLFGRPL